MFIRTVAFPTCYGGLNSVAGSCVAVNTAYESSFLYVYWQGEALKLYTLYHLMICAFDGALSC